jgi:hypothetical protein
MELRSGATGIVPRRAVGLVREALADTPVVVVQGARQVGKSTLVQLVLDGSGVEVASLDLAGEREAAERDPDAYVRRRPGGLMVIDEVQRVPDLLLAVKAAVDADRRPGRFLLTGSADLVSHRRAGDSLAGRAETVTLHGLSQGEISGGADRLVDVLLAGDEVPLSDLRSDLSRGDYLELACAGSYPEARLRTGRRRAAWYDNYLSRLTRRDVLDVEGVSAPERLPRLLRVLAANNAGEMVRARTAVDAQIPETTVTRYLEVLVDLFLVHTLPAWGATLSTRVVGRPKVALLDTGLAARLANLTPDAMETGPLATHAGPLLEALVAGELRRQQTWSADGFEMFHFRRRDGPEVDIVVEDGRRRVVGIEVKATSRVRPQDVKGFELLRSVTGERFAMGVVLHTGPSAVRWGERIWALPIAALWQ